MSWDRLARQFGPSPGLPGIEVPQVPMGTATTVVPTASMTHYQRFVCPRTMEVDRAFFRLQTADAVDVPMEIAIYDGSTLAKVGTTGSVTGKLNAGAPGRVQVNFTTNVSLIGGQPYYLGFAVGAGGSTHAVNHFLFSNAGMGEVVSDVTPYRIAGQQAVYPAPATMGALANNTFNPYVFLRERGT